MTTVTAPVIQEVFDIDDYASFQDMQCAINDWVDGLMRRMVIDFSRTTFENIDNGMIVNLYII
jgi:hypothetical protein